MNVAYRVWVNADARRSGGHPEGSCVPASAKRRQRGGAVLIVGAGRPPKLPPADGDPT